LGFLELIGGQYKNPQLMEFKITPREKEVLDLISKGYSYREIAEKLFISEETVISHRKHLLSNFIVHNSAELIRAAMENNLL
jgi:DNA-binding CsgD family transcriptional regulator